MIYVWFWMSYHVMLMILANRNVLHLVVGGKNEKQEVGAYWPEESTQRDGVEAVDCRNAVEL